ncbi:hypothetical protein ACFL5Z_19740, partial [Planctomycetota bacterium]
NQMEKYRGFILALAIAVTMFSVALPCPAGEKEKKDNQDGQDIFEDVPSEQRTGRRRGRGRFELTEDEIDRIMQETQSGKSERACGTEKEEPGKIQKRT